MTAPRVPQPRLTGVDLAGLGFGAAGLLWSAIAVLKLAPNFAAMFADFGSPSAMPAITQLFLTGWFPFALALAPIATVVAGVAIDAPRTMRLVLTLLAGLMTLALPAGFLFSMYLPIFALADKVR